MGEIRVWDLAKRKQVAKWTTGSFTGWGIIKGHYYTGGIFDMRFSDDSNELLVCGMGSTRDPPPATENSFGRDSIGAPSRPRSSMKLTPANTVPA